LAKNTVRVFALGMLANLFRVRRRLLLQGTECRRVRRDRPIWADSALCCEHGERRMRSYRHLWALADSYLFHTARDSCLIKVSLGFVVSLNNKARVIQRRCSGIRDEQYLRLKVLTCTLPPIPRDENGLNHPHDSSKSHF
jgi:hypothetical protein